MGDFSAIRPGTDLPTYARELIRMHDAVLSGSQTPLRPRPMVARSWSRMREAGLTADLVNSRMLLSIEEIERRRRSPLAAVFEEIVQVLRSITEDPQLIVVLTDAEGVVLWRSGSTRVKLQADAVGFREGAVWTEATVGTNGIGTALAEAAPVQLFSGEHYEQSQHGWYCTAAPIHDPRTGELLGVIDLSGPALTLHPAITALVTTVARLAESKLQSLHRDQLERLRTAAGPAIASSTGPVLLVDEHGWVAHASGVAPTRRIAAPRGERALHVPGVGLCVPERFGDGWLVRQRADSSCIRLELELSGVPTVIVTGPESGWRTGLSARHAEILLLLHRAGRAGMSVTELSEALYGDADHAVTVRAEVSRLRRVLGSLIDNRPYRILDTVELTVTLGAERFADCEFVRSAASPAVRALAGTDSRVTG
ncbi:GAF domain-containing protein [Nocardia sp. ET3-3]|uniref:GAF domain-containing protein n=1 Tax=Nocardia terrae TaxID=2675851 RepID=A0A7K1V5K1_9NOCA|nr:GAF domain-containing protein [Nocardia terrae]